MARALLFFFVSPFWAACWLPALMLAAAGVQGREGCSPKRCGNLTISVPFWLVSEPEGGSCASLGFQVHCNGSTPYLGYYQTDFSFQILEIFHDNHTLLVSDIHKLGDFRSSSNKGCHVPPSNTSSKLGAPFSAGTLNQNLIFYNCTKAPAPAPADQGLAETRCRNNTFVRAGGRYNETSDNQGYFLEGCSATVMPVLQGASGEVNASNYVELISEGFLLTWHGLSDSGKLARQIIIFGSY